MFYRGVPIDHFTYITSPVNQSSAENEYNASFTAEVDLEHFIIINNELMYKDPDVVTEQEYLIILDIKSSVCMTNNGKDTKHIRYISIIIHL